MDGNLKKASVGLRVDLRSKPSLKRLRSGGEAYAALVLVGRRKRQTKRPVLMPIRCKHLNLLGGRTRARTWDPLIKSQPRVEDNQ